MIKVEGLTKRYARNVAVDHISFEVEKGQIVGFLGPNGAGKTTTMRMLTCFMPPTDGTRGSGRIRRPGEPHGGEAAHRLPAGNAAGLSRRWRSSSTWNSWAGSRVFPRPSLAKRIDEVMEKCAIADVRNKEIGKLSKGYRQRVGLAQAIIHNPDVLILDEPTAGLDPHQIIETRDLIKGLAGDHTIILSTHILPEVEQICERVIIIAKGKLVATDTVENLTSRLRGAETVAVEVTPRATSPADNWFRSRCSSGWNRWPASAACCTRNPRTAALHFTVESLQGRHIRPELARAVIEAGWNLNELHAVGLSLEEIFLQLTAAAQAGTRRADAGSRPSPEAVAEACRNWEKRNEHIHHLPQGAEQLFPLADRLRRDGVFRSDRRVFLLRRRRCSSCSAACKPR